MGRVRDTIGRTKHALSRVKIRGESRLGILDDVAIEPFLCWGNASVLHVQGRIIEAKGIRKPHPDDTMLTGIRNTLNRLDSDEIPDAVLSVQNGDGAVEITADAEGFFRCDVSGGAPFDPGWHHVSIELVSSIAGDVQASAVADVLVPHPNSQYVVISDLDDTVVVTGATDKLRMFRLVATKNAHEREVFPGVGGLYRAFRAGRDGWPENAIFYVTRSGWNLDDLFVQILDEKNVPRGPLLMQDFAHIEPPSESFSEQRTKFDWFEILFADLPHDFVLIGDSGQHDPENFLECVKRWPGRVRAVFIRDVTTPRRDREVHDIADEIRTLGVPVSVSDSTLDFAREAVRFGLIEATAVAAVERDIEKAEAPE